MCAWLRKIGCISMAGLGEGRKSEEDGATEEGGTEAGGTEEGEEWGHLQHCQSQEADNHRREFTRGVQLPNPPLQAVATACAAVDPAPVLSRCELLSMLTAGPQRKYPTHYRLLEPPSPAVRATRQLPRSGPLDWTAAESCQKRLLHWGYARGAPAKQATRLCCLCVQKCE